MKRTVLAVVALGLLADRGLAQEFVIGGPTFGGSEPLYSYDDRDPWKHGWIQEIPYYGGYHSFRPYNYKQVYAQSAQAAAWGMPHNMPYSQQYYHRYEELTGNEFPNLSAIQSSPFGPHPSARHQPQWNALQQSPVVNAEFNRRHGAANPEQFGPIDFQQVHQSPASGPEFQRAATQEAQIRELLLDRPRHQGPAFDAPIPAAGVRAE